MTNIVGWDIGAVNVKAAWVAQNEDRTVQMRFASRPFEIWREKDRLQEILRLVFESIIAGTRPQAMAVTMTAELSDTFASKREGVLFVLQNLNDCFHDLPAYVFSVSGEFVPLGRAKSRPLEFAASNWLASATWIAMKIPDCLIIDVGSTTTDILPIIDGQVCVSGRTDTDRLASGELVYTGVLRTNLAAIVSSVPVHGRPCRVASEYFAISGDIHLILGNLAPDDYVCTTPDGRPPSIDSACKRVARLVCADTEMLSIAEIIEMSRFIYHQQVCLIRDGIEQVISRFPDLRSRTVIPLGSGAFLGEAAAKDMGLEIGKMASEFGRGQLTVAPCIAVAQLLSRRLGALLQ
jgi:(4-(4-[2-(gamma-L-glutamylamino)ethyl]phenoxymethyl)furan-2-yl)methanamine synthase